MWFKTLSLLLAVALSVNAAHLNKRDVAAEIRGRAENFRDGCFPQGSGQGCRCTTTVDGKEETKVFETIAECQKPNLVAQTVENKAKVNAELKEKVANFRDGCFPKPSGGCRCNEKNAEGVEVTVNHDSVAECGEQHDQAAIEAKQAVNTELKEKFGDLKENCYPKPSGGCRCVEKAEDGSEQTKLYDADVDCKVKARRKRDQSRSSSPVSQNVRDPVREKAAQNYQAVLNELKDKFRGLKEGCYPRPKGCLCVIGKDQDGRDLTQRRMKDSDCKCQPGETGPGCPATGA